MGIEEALETPGFWILGALGVGATLVGWIVSRKAGWVALPLWQLIVIILVILVASAYFATKD